MFLNIEFWWLVCLEPNELFPSSKRYVFWAGTLVWQAHQPDLDIKQGFGYSKHKLFPAFGCHSCSPSVKYFWLFHRYRYYNLKLLSFVYLSLLQPAPNNSSKKQRWWIHYILYFKFFRLHWEWTVCLWLRKLLDI